MEIIITTPKVAVLSKGITIYKEVPEKQVSQIVRIIEKAFLSRGITAEIKFKEDK